MASLSQCGFFMLIVYLSLQCWCQKMNPFPLHDCGSNELDILFIGNKMLESVIWFRDRDFPTKFCQYVLNFLLPSGKEPSQRIKIAGSSSHYSRDISFVDYPGNNCSSVINMSEDKTMKDTLAYAVNSFLEESGARTTAIHLVVMIVTECQEESLQEIKNYQNQRFRQSDVRLFVAFVTSNITCDGIPYTVRVDNHQQLFSDQRFPLAICRQCIGDGWVAYEHALGLSCHKIVTTLSNVHWYQANNECAKQGATLAELDSEEEIHHVKKLRQGTHSSLVNNVTQDNSSFDAMYIGLFKDKWQLTRSFQWRNTRPVLTHHWLKDKTEDVDANAFCAVWLFTRATEAISNNLTDTETTESTSDLKDGWSGIGCGIEQTNSILCEVSVVYFRNPELKSLQVMPASKEAYLQALGRGEFVDLNGKIVSLSTLNYNQFAEMSLPKDKVAQKYFSCSEDEKVGDLIPYSLVCDQQNHCRNNRDERDCQYRKCDTTEFACRRIALCIPQEARCDLFKDCPDGSDEEQCPGCSGLMCCDGQCLPPNRFLDGEVDCSPCRVKYGPEKNMGIHDEIFDSKTEVKLGCVFICNRTRCVNWTQLNDSVVDCTGPEGPLDETIGKLERVNACSIHRTDRPEEKFQLWAPKCVYVKDRLGGVLGCRNLAHLQDCADFTCPEGYVKCPESYCIPMHVLQDGQIDCAMGEDEFYIEHHNCTGNFECSNSRVCLHPDLICDGHAHCPLGDDERNCNVSCQKGFSCIVGTVVVTDSNKAEPLVSLAFVDNRTRYLDLSGINLSSLLETQGKGQFVNIFEIRMSNCTLSNVTAWFVLTPQRLETVLSVDLSYNNIHVIPNNNNNNNMFAFMMNLRKLNLSNNFNLIHIHENGLCPVNIGSKLNVLDLSGTGLSYVNTNTFNCLRSLRYLNLSFTKIVTLQSKAFPLQLTELDLRHMQVDDFQPDSLSELSISLSMYTDNHKLCCPQVRGPGIPEHTCHTTEDAISSCSNLVGMKLQCIILWIVGIIAVFGNGIVIAYRVLILKDVTKKAFSMFVINLSISDVIMGIYLLTIAGADMYYRDTYIWNDTRWRHSILCQFGGFLSTLSSETSTFFIFLITVDRYVALKFPFGQYNFSKPAMYLCTILSWAVGFLLALIPKLPTFNYWVVYSSNGMCLGLPLTTKRLPGWAYSVAIFIVLNFVMFIVIACGQYLIYKAMADNRITVAYSSARRVQDINVAKQLSLVVLTNFLCWFPVGLLGLLAASGVEIGPEAYAWSAVMILPINSALNPILYTIPILLAKWEQFKLGHFKKQDACRHTEQTSKF